MQPQPRHQRVLTPLKVPTGNDPGQTARLGAGGREDKSQVFTLCLASQRLLLPDSLLYAWLVPKTLCLFSFHKKGHFSYEGRSLGRHFILPSFQPLAICCRVTWQRSAMSAATSFACCGCSIASHVACLVPFSFSLLLCLGASSCRGPLVVRWFNDQFDLPCLLLSLGAWLKT